MGGAAALFAATAYTGTALLRELGMDIDPLASAEKAAQIGGAAGLGAWVFRLVGLN